MSSDIKDKIFDALLFPVARSLKVGNRCSIDDFGAIPQNLHDWQLELSASLQWEMSCVARMTIPIPESSLIEILRLIPEDGTDL